MRHDYNTNSSVVTEDAAFYANQNNTGILSCMNSGNLAKRKDYYKDLALKWVWNGRKSKCWQN